MDILQSTPISKDDNDDGDIEQGREEVPNKHHRRRSSSSFRFPSSVTDRASSVHDTAIINSLRQSVAADCQQIDEAQDAQALTPGDSLLQQTIQNACHSAFGIIGVDV